MRLLLWIAFCFLPATSVFAQFRLSPINPLHTAILNRHVAEQKLIRVTAFMPYLVEIDEFDSLTDGFTNGAERNKHSGYIARKMRNDHLIEVRESDFTLMGDFAFNLEAAAQRDNQGRRNFTNTRGFNFSGTVGERFFFASSFYENQSIFPSYMDSVVSERGDFNNPLDPERGSVPGFGRWKSFNTSTSYDYDYTLATGYVGLVINNLSFIMFGQDKQFVGYGYRSVLLSDAAAPYPMLRTHLSFFKGRLTYTTTWAVLQYLERVAPINYSNKEALFRRIGGRFSYVHFQPNHWFGVGLFDGSTWGWKRNARPASVEYYLPHTLIYSGQGIINRIVGFNGNVSPTSFLSVYGQFAMNFSAGGNAWQGGVKIFNLPAGLEMRTEYNQVSQGFYHAAADPQQNRTLVSEPFQQGTFVQNYYQHNDAMLGHPIGVEMREWIVRLQYSWRDAFLSGAYHHMQIGSAVSPSKRDFFQFEVGYTFNSKSNMQLVLGNINRNEKSLTSSAIDTYTYLAFRTLLFNRYLDF